eukprot:336103-Chlamydomonas_euryale.AAC.1
MHPRPVPAAGSFPVIKARCVPKQATNRRLVDVAAQQSLFDFQNQEGVLVGACWTLRCLDTWTFMDVKRGHVMDVAKVVRKASFSRHRSTLAQLLPIFLPGFILWLSPVVAPCGRPASS